MLALRDTDIGGNFENWHEQVSNGETVIVSGSRKENVIIISEKDYNEMMKAKRNADYLAMLDRAYADIEQGKGITKTWEELEEMAKDE